tara:strand:+ start:232 stop:486 length:255 start_codon:yes stop_codon:yes gene_type:complete
MNKLIVTGITLTGISIVSLTVATISKSNAIKKQEKVITKLMTFNDILTRVVVSQFERPDGAGVMIPAELEIELQAFTIFNENQM